MKNPISFYYPFESFLFYPPLEINRPKGKGDKKGGEKKEREKTREEE